MSPTRWGIAGCGKISSDFSTAIQHEGSSKHVVLAVAARSMATAQQFGDKFGALRSYDSYGKLGQDEDIDVVYVGTINTTHSEIVKNLLIARKPVLCEKPMCLSLVQTEELVALAKKQNTFLMEAVWSCFCPAFRELKSRLDEGEIGEVSHAFVTFGQPMDNVQRLIQKDLGGGSVLDIGIYAITFLLCAMGGEEPKEVQAVGNINEESVEGEVSAAFRFSNGRFGTFILSIKSVLPNEAYVTGSKGTIKLENPFWSSEQLTSPSGDFKFPLDPSDRIYNFVNSQGLKHQADEVAKCLKEGRTESCIMPLSRTLLLADLIQTVRQKVGAVQY